MMDIRLKTAYSFHQQGRRDHQEDSRFPDVEQASDKQRFFVVCDGVGGSEKGEVASGTVCRAIGRFMSDVDFSCDFTNDAFHQLLDASYDALDKAANRENKEMATTMTFVCFHAGGCTMAHIGDSRIYQIRPSEGILYRSDDHSLVNSMVRNGMITPEEAQEHPQRNVITRFMEPVDADQNRCMATVMRTMDVRSGDYFLLCTDGVLHCISDDLLLQILTGDESDEMKMRQLAELSKESEDNNTAWLISIADVINGVSPGRTAENIVNEKTSNTKRMPTYPRNLEEIESVQTKRRKLVGWLKSLKILSL